MRHCALLTIAFISISAFAQSEPAIFIPQSPLNPIEVAELKERLKRNTGITDAMIENMVKDESKYHTYRERDIVAAFPELGGDKKLSVCSNSIMSGATEIVYISDAKENEVTVKSVHCARVDKGLACGAISREKNYFLDSPEHFFSLENLTLREARMILEAYKANRIDGLPDSFGARPEVRSIKALPDVRYRLGFGEYYCSGCATVFNVRLETNESEPRLVYAGDPGGGCF
jgi:hypothetical protein